MNLCDRNEIEKLLARHGFHFSKARGQNFLIENWVPREIAEQSEIDETCGVLEVGPGIGALTQELCRTGAQVVSVEVDKTLLPILRETMGDYKNFTLVPGDILKTDLPALKEQYFTGLRPVVCANLPYQITSPVLSAILSSRCFTNVTVMVQREVALRICAEAGSRDYSGFTVLCQYYASPRILFEVPPECFLPRPKVYSAVVSKACRQETPCPISDEKLFFQVVRASFAQRRKTLANGLSAGFPGIPKETVISCIRNAGFPETVRGETLDIPGFARVTEELQKYLP